MATAETKVGEVVEIPKGEVRYTLGPNHPPVALVAAGTRLRIETELNIGNVLHRIEDRFDASMVRLPFVNPVTGPIFVKGATQEQVLVCEIEQIELMPPGFT